MKEKIFRVDLAERDEILLKITLLFSERKGIAFVYVYGSFIEGRPFHDIDVGVFFAEEVALKELSDSLDIASLLSAELCYPVDVRVLNNAPVAFRYNVIKGRLVFEGDGDRCGNFVEDTIRRYLDMKPLLLRATREAFAA